MQLPRDLERCEAQPESIPEVQRGERDKAVDECMHRSNPVYRFRREIAACEAQIPISAKGDERDRAYTHCMRAKGYSRCKDDDCSNLPAYQVGRTR